jgi:predicted NBD/HSP70 family sugar kinase
LGIGIASLVNIFNPELIILSGFFGEIYLHVEMAVREQVRTRAMAPARNFVNIVPAMLGPDAALLGAAEFALEEILADPTLIPSSRDASNQAQEYAVRQAIE